MKKNKLQNIVLAHNKYKHIGGEDAVFESELAMLVESEFNVETFIKNNEEINTFSKKIMTLLRSIYSTKIKNEFYRLYERKNIDVTHVHNLYPLISPSIFDAAKRVGSKTILTLHNYRTICPTSILLLDGFPNERSIKTKSPFWAIKHKTYQNSFIGTAALASFIKYHQDADNWNEKVDRFICLTEFSKSKFIEAGFNANKISVKPNFVCDFGLSSKKINGNKFSACFIGRDSVEKGLNILLEAWTGMDAELNVVGVNHKNILPKTDKIIFHGWKSKSEVREILAASNVLIVPSVCYEGFPMVILEAYSLGIPVICSDIGSLAEVVIDGETGLHFNVGSANHLTQKLDWLASNPKAIEKFGKNARKIYEKKYTKEKNLELLKEIYNLALMQ